MCKQYKEKDKALKQWKDTWEDEVHTTDYATKRIKSAKSAKLTPIEINKSDLYGYFQGSSGRYETFLDSCSCIDFAMHRRPCKHIYRLAIELGLMDLEAQNNPDAVLLPRKERASLEQTIDIIEKLSEEAQGRLLSIASEIRSTTPVYQVRCDYILAELIKCGIIVDREPQNHSITFGLKKDIQNLLDSEKIPYKKSSKKKILEDLCIQHIPEKAAKIFGQATYVTIPAKFSPRNIHFYLNRKYYNYTLEGEVLPLPDDAITIQLKKRGYFTDEN
mgnify:CR=1 FL=1